MDTDIPLVCEGRGVLQEIRCDGNIHRCDRFCTFRHVFGNLYECQRSGKNHICDQNCTELLYYDSTTYICRLSKKLFEREAETGMAISRRRRREHESEPENPKRMCYQQQ